MQDDVVVVRRGHGEEEEDDEDMEELGLAEPVEHSSSSSVVDGGEPHPKKPKVTKDLGELLFG
jgi:hypothetical protein